MKGGFQLLLLAAVPLFCRGAVDLCRGVSGFETFPEDQTGFFSYLYTEDAGAPTRTCDTVTLECNATIPNERLRQRIWYIDETKAYHGLSYRPSYIQVYNIQCPSETVLHIIPLVLDTEDTSGNAGNCPVDDFISIDIPGQDSINLCGGESQLMNSPAFNGGLGLVVGNGTAAVSFCSNGNAAVRTGVAVRAMCVDPKASFLPGCVDFNAKLESQLGKEFIDRVNEVEEVDKANILHKRSVEETSDSLSLKRWGVHPKDAPRDVTRFIKRMERHRRQKRFVNGVIIIQLEEEHMVTYEDTNMLTVDFNNGTVREFGNVEWLVTLNSLVGTRIFDRSAPFELVLQGPGMIFISDQETKAMLFYTVGDIESLILPNNMRMTEIINMITRYVYRNYIRPFPFTTPSDSPTVQFVPLPFASSDDPQGRYRSASELNFIQPDVQNGVCVRGTVIADAPARDSFIDRDILDFCRHFYYSCNAMLSAVCREAMLIAA